MRKSCCKFLIHVLCFSLVFSPLSPLQAKQVRYPTVEELASKSSESECNQYLTELQSPLIAKKLEACRILEKVRKQAEKNAYEFTRNLCYYYKWKRGFTEGTAPTIAQILKSQFYWGKVRWQGFTYLFDDHRDLRNIFEEHKFFLYEKQKRKKRIFVRKRSHTPKYDPNNPDHHVIKEVAVAIDFGDTVGTNFVHYLIGSPGFYYGSRACLDPEGNLGMKEQFKRINDFIRTIRVSNYLGAAPWKAAKLTAEFVVGLWIWKLLRSIWSLGTILVFGSSTFIASSAPEETAYEDTDEYKEFLASYMESLSAEFKQDNENFRSLPSDKQIRSLKHMVGSYFRYSSLRRLLLKYIPDMNTLELKKEHQSYIEENVAINPTDNFFYGDRLRACIDEKMPISCYMDLGKEMEPKMSGDLDVYHDSASYLEAHMFILNRWSINLQEVADSTEDPVEAERIQIRANIVKDSINIIKEYSQYKFDLQWEFGEFD